MKAVILAGGKGTRLRPYTTNFPKPLMPINDKPILEIVIRQLKSSGIDDIIITTGHLEELIRAFFKDGSKYGVNITYSREERPLGTAGPLNLIREHLTDTFVVMNGDVLCDINFRELIRYHRQEKNQATIVLSRRNVNIDFGVVDITKNNLFSNWQEKPTLEYLVSAGIYLFEPVCLAGLDNKEFFNLPDLIVRLDKLNTKIKAYIHDGFWLDIGRPEDYEKACKDFNGTY